MLTNVPLRTPEALYDTLVDGGFADTARRLQAASRPCLRLLGVQRPNAGNAVISRIGGRPDLPPSLRWPGHEGRAFSFLAQVVLDELPDAGSLGLPDHGVLYFFYDTARALWGFAPSHRDGFAVLHTDARPLAATATPFPDSLPAEERFPALSVAPIPTLSFPEPGTGLGLEWATEATDDDQAFAICERYVPVPGPRHQVRGRPRILQNDMEEEAQLVTNGLDCGGSIGIDDPRRKVLEAGAADWSLLLQLDSDRRTGMMWGDAGKLYYWIHEEDLRARQFDHTWLILQCS